MNTKSLTSTALLTALAIVIPLIVFFKVVLPPFFTATLGSHTPMFLSMFLGPGAAIMVGLGSTLGFQLSVGPEVAARAFMHVFVGLIGAILIKKKFSYIKAVVITAPIHGLLEVVVSMLILTITNRGIDLSELLIATGIGTVIHHFIDSIIAYSVIRPLRAANILQIDNNVL